MKKFLTVLFAVLFLTTGCGERTSLEVLDDVLLNMKDVTSMQADYKVVMSMDQEGVNVNIDLPFSMVVAGKDTDAKFKISVGENAFIGKFEAYGDVTKKEAKFYIPSTLIDSFMGVEGEETKWLSIVTNLEDLETEETDIDTKELEEKIKNLDYKKVILEENFVYVDEKDNIGHYQLVIDEALVKRLATELGEEYDVEEMSKLKIKLDVYIDLKNNQVTKVYFDMKELMKNIAAEESSEDLGLDMDAIKDLYIEMNFKDYNNATVTIPDAVKDALDFETYISGLEFEEDYEY